MARLLNHLSVLGEAYTQELCRIYEWTCRLEGLVTDQDAYAWVFEDAANKTRGGMSLFRFEMEKQDSLEQIDHLVAMKAYQLFNSMMGVEDA